VVVTTNQLKNLLAMRKNDAYWADLVAFMSGDALKIILGLNKPIGHLEKPPHLGMLR
jgi:hypothetical protein